MFWQCLKQCLKQKNTIHCVVRYVYDTVCIIKIDDPVSRVNGRIPPIPVPRNSSGSGSGSGSGRGSGSSM